MDTIIQRLNFHETLEKTFPFFPLKLFPLTTKICEISPTHSIPRTFKIRERKCK